MLERCKKIFRSENSESKFWSTRGASHHPVLMENYPTFGHRCLFSLIQNDWSENSEKGKTLRRKCLKDAKKFLGLKTRNLTTH